MKCQRCGVEIGEGMMYCPACGHEIQIVPDFEPEVENTINQAMDHILMDVFHKDISSKRSSSKKNPETGAKKKVRKRHFFRWMIPLILISCCVLYMVYGYMNHTTEYQIRRASYYMQFQQYDEAIEHLEKAGKIDPTNIEIELYLAQCYEAIDKMAGYEACLTKVIQSEYSTEEYLRIAYTRLANLYLENQEYQKINKLLKTCKDIQVIERFGIYRAQLPKYSHDSGEYKDIIPLRIQGGEKGCVYYTMDGTDPTVESKVYSSPIFLYEGEHVIKAIYVNEFGVSSEVITAKFKIKF